MSWVRSSGWRFARNAGCSVVATLLAWSPLTPYVVVAQPPVASEAVDVEPVSTERDVAATELRRDLSAEGVVSETSIDREAVADRMAADYEASQSEDLTPLSLPGGETPSAVSPQSISLPTAEGSISGMGESFAPVLSSGTATFSVPIAVAPGRAGVQPSLSLAYSTSGGNGSVGFGWGLGVPFIARQTDRGLPRYVDRPAWTAEEDRFVYNGGQELVPVDSAAMAAVDAQAAGDADATAVPADVAGWQQYRARVEGGFMRFFRAPPDVDGRVSRWVVQSKDGTRFDFGLLPTGEGPPELAGTGNQSLEVDDEDGHRVYQWMLTRMSDAHGSTVYYQYLRDAGGQLFLEDVYYVSPAACRGAYTSPSLDSAAAARSCQQSLSAYGARVHLTYESRPDVFTSYRSGYPLVMARRLASVEVSAWNDAIGARARVRRYRLSYQPDAFHSLLASVQVEGRPSSTPVYGAEVGDDTIPEGASATGPLLPPMTFSYTALPSAPGAIDGFGALSATVHRLSASPPHSIDEARSDFFDVNSDGLPDLIVTDPARYRASDGSPAVGVFFNGFSGSDAQPGTAGEFSGAVPMPMRSDLSGTLSLSNLNIVPMDIDGDGRSDMLHMPRVRSYGWFAATRQQDPIGAATIVSPAQQGWRWTYATIDLPAGDLDPRIDFGRDSSHFELMDVNADRLIDVVRTTGTSIQTWLNLGWIPERDAAGRPAGDGRFGSATFDGTHWQLSTQPITSCLVTAGLPLDFSDSESRLADMNGDNIVDLVRIRQGRVIWWPGRGTGSFGTGAHDCSSGFADDRYVEMATPPAEINAELAGVQLADIDGDGATDVVQIRFDAVDVWFNRAGQSFTPRFTVRGTPFAPDFAPRVRLMDIDGSGTTDVVYADGSSWQWVDLLDHTQPRMLVSVDNGLGALTSIDYDTSATDYLRDLHAATTTCTDESTGCDRFVWSRIEGAPSTRLAARAPSEPASNMFHAAGTPVISTVVRRIRTTDRFGLYSAEQVSETSFEYHDGYYEGIEQEFRGFGAADSITVGDELSPSVRTRTWFNQGRRPQAIADDRLAFSDDEALKGREYLTEVFDERGVYLSSAHATMTSRTLAYGLDQRPIQYAFVSQADEIRYDTTGYAPLNGVAHLPEIVRETLGAHGALATQTVDRYRDVRVRGARAVMIRTTYDEVDNLGQVRQQTAHGRVHVDGTILPTDDPPIVTHTTPILQTPSAWIWRTERSAVENTGPTDLLRETRNTYDAVGDLVASAQTVHTPRAYAFAGEGGATGAASLSQDSDSVDDLVASSVLDPWGQSVASCVGALPSDAPSGCFRYATVARDTAFDQLATTETAYTDHAGHHLTTVGTWDRGLGVLTSASDPNALETRVTYDGLGRLTSVSPPAAEGCPTVGAHHTGLPTTIIHYDLTTAPSSQPVSRVITTTQLSCASVGSDTLVSMGYVDGLGRVRATLATGPGDGEGDWVRSGLTRLDPKGAVREAWQTDFFSGSPDVFTSVLAVPGESFPHTRSVYDAFGRVRVAYAEDGSMATTSYHALSTDVCDPLDNDATSMHFGTCTTARTDGHGRLIDQLLRNREPGRPGTETHRLWTYYRNDGAVLELVRAQVDGSTLRPTVAADAEAGGYPHVFRTFIYDTVGRRIGSDDPDTNDRSNPDESSNSWRYLFNRAGDLAAVRDPRGCGQNFYYDLGGRLLGEQYVGCGAHAGEYQSGEDPDDVPENYLEDAVSMTAGGNAPLVDVQYFYDAEPTWLTGAPASNLLGRATGVRDRAQRAGVAYDDRGNAIWTQREVAVISSAATLDTSTLGSGGAPHLPEPPATSSTVVYDTVHPYVRTAHFDHAGRPVTMSLPTDPDWDGGTDGTSAPLVSGALAYDRRGLPRSADLLIGSIETVHVVSAIHYLRDGLVDHIEYGDHDAAPVVTSTTEYDERRRPTRLSSVRAPTSPSGFQSIGAIADQRLVWDAASNLTAVIDQRDPAEWIAGHRPQSVEIQHDSLYRVVAALFNYTEPGDATPRVPFETIGADTSTDWRDDAAESNAVDPMHPRPAPVVSSQPSTRVQALTWDWDWLGNMDEWTDDAQQFYERSIGEIANGYDVAARPSALYLASNLSLVSSGELGGYVELDYGVGGNVTSVAVHGQCVATSTCRDPGGSDLDARRAALATCACAETQFYAYRWDELNRISEARRLDQHGGGAAWSLEARQRYRYDGANVRVVKQSFDTHSSRGAESRVALYVYPGDFERRGVIAQGMEYAAAGVAGALETETQYLVAGARMVWQHADDTAMYGRHEDRNHRVTIPVSDLLHTTGAVVDLRSGELIEVSTYFPNGARETLLNEASYGEGGGGTGAAVPLEPMGFTGKEADEDVGLVYFGERYLIARVGRWASPDPLHVYASGGGVALNAYHYTAGNLLQAADALGLDAAFAARLQRVTAGLADDFDLDMAVLRRVQATLSPLDDGPLGLYDPGGFWVGPRMFVRQGSSEAEADITIIHESVHGYIDQYSPLSSHARGGDSRIMNYMRAARDFYDDLTYSDGLRVDPTAAADEAAAYYVEHVVQAHRDLAAQAHGFMRSLVEHPDRWSSHQQRVDTLRRFQENFESQMSHAGRDVSVSESEYGEHDSETFERQLPPELRDQLDEVFFGRDVTSSALEVPALREAMAAAGVDESELAASSVGESSVGVPAHAE